ncbi:MAG: hypothetical protein ACI83B_003506, partial [Sediminicola sp.]
MGKSLLHAVNPLKTEQNLLIDRNVAKMSQLYRYQIDAFIIIFVM